MCSSDLGTVGGAPRSSHGVTRRRGGSSESGMVPTWGSQVSTVAARACAGRTPRTTHATSGVPGGHHQRPLGGIAENLPATARLKLQLGVAAEGAGGQQAEAETSEECRVKRHGWNGAG